MRTFDLRTAALVIIEENIEKATSVREDFDGVLKNRAGGQISLAYQLGLIDAQEYDRYAARLDYGFARDRINEASETL